MTRRHTGLLGPRAASGLYPLLLSATLTPLWPYARKCRRAQRNEQANLALPAKLGSSLFERSQQGSDDLAVRELLAGLQFRKSDLMMPCNSSVCLQQ